MEFQLLGHKIEISNGKKKYVEIINYFTNMANRATECFNAHVGNQLMEQYEDNSLNYYYADYVSEVRKYLSQHGIYTVSEREMWNQLTTEYGGKTYLQSAFDAVFDKIVADTPNYESKDDRTWHIVKNSLKELDSGRFNQAIKVDIMALCDFVIDCLTKNNEGVIQVVYEENAKKAKAIYENLIVGNVPEQERDALAPSLIELDFSETEYYRYIFRYFPSARFEVAAITKYLGIDITDLIENDIKCTFNLNSIANEEGAKTMMSELKVMMEKYAIDHSAIQTELENILRDYDIKARTYDKVLYETRELRTKAENDDKDIAAMYSGLEVVNKEEYLAVIATVDSKPYDEGIKNKHISILQRKICEIERNEMEKILKGLETATEAECNKLMECISDYNAVVAQKDAFKRRIQARVNLIWKAELDALLQGVEEMTEAACDIAKEGILAHCAPEEIKKEYLVSIEKRIHTIWDAEDFERFSELYKQTPVDDSVAVGQTGSLIQREGRTETKELFVKALYLLNENEVTAAAKYALAKEGGMLSTLLNIGKKESYQILTLNGRVMHPAIEAAMQAQREAKGTGLLGGLGKLKNSFGFGKVTSSPNKVCPNCGKAIAQDVNFCPNCGNKID